ncbi:cellulose-binding protein [bacterium SCSIO 12696]|nr:cellulose-binding protein [bacterium SCSIO 12696]
MKSAAERLFRALLLLVSAMGLFAMQSAANPSLKDQSSIGMGLSGIADWSTQFPFLNIMRSSREWYDWDRNSPEGIVVDEYGELVSVEAGVRPAVVFLTNIEEHPIVYDRYIVRWKGAGGIEYDWCAKKVGESNGGDVIETREDSCLIRVSSFDPSDPIREIEVVPAKFIENYDRGEVFNPDFLANIGRFRALRFMDWMITNGSTQNLWSDRPTPKHRSFAQKGVPIEYMVRLANELGSDPWFNMPHLATDQYIKNFAKVVQNSLDKNLTAYVEYSNEVWNWLFPQSQYALKASRELWDKEGDAYMQWHGMKTANICKIWKNEVFLEEKHRVNCVLGAHATWPGLETSSLDCPLWKENKGSCQDHGIDSVAIAAYFTGCINTYENDLGQRKVEEWLNESDGGLQKAFEQAFDSRHFPCEFSAAEMEKVYAYHVGVARSRGLQVLAYEGGQHITGNFEETQTDQRFIALHIGLNRDERMRRLYERNFKSWRDAGGGLFFHFVDVSVPGQYGSWGALEYVTQPTSPKWQALLNMNAQPCWWDHCVENK